MDDKIYLYINLYIYMWKNKLSYSKDQMYKTVRLVFDSNRCMNLKIYSEYNTWKNDYDDFLDDSSKLASI